MDSVDDAKRRIGLSIENITQGGRSRTDELRKILLSEVLIFHQLSDSIFHALKFIVFIFVLFRCFISEQGQFCPIFGCFYKGKTKI